MLSAFSTNVWVVKYWYPDWLYVLGLFMDSIQYPQIFIIVIWDQTIHKGIWVLWHYWCITWRSDASNTQPFSLINRSIFSSIYRYPLLKHLYWLKLIFEFMQLFFVQDLSIGIIFFQLENHGVNQSISSSLSIIDLYRLVSMYRREGISGIPRSRSDRSPLEDSVS